MLSNEERRNIKEKVTEVLNDLNINSRINFAYFLDAIDTTNKRVNSLDSKLQRIISNQYDIDRKLDMIIRRLERM